MIITHGGLEYVVAAIAQAARSVELFCVPVPVNKSDEETYCILRCKDVAGVRPDNPLTRGEM